MRSFCGLYPSFMSINRENLQTCTTSAVPYIEYSQKTGTSVCTNMHQPAPMFDTYVQCVLSHMSRARARMVNKKPETSILASGLIRSQLSAALARLVLFVSQRCQMPMSAL